MKRWNRVCLYVWMAVGAWVASADPALLAHWPFDEGEGGIARDSAAQSLEAELDPGIEWVEGAFGTALAFPGNGPQVPVVTSSSTQVAPASTPFCTRSVIMSQTDACTAGSVT